MGDEGVKGCRGDDGMKGEKGSTGRKGPSGLDGRPGAGLVSGWGLRKEGKGRERDSHVQDCHKNP